MKKPSLSKDGIQQFFLANGEKLLLGLTVVILLGFFYSALTAKPLDESNSPEAIKMASNTLQSQVGTPTWDDKKKEMNLASPEFPNLAEGSSKPISALPFIATREWKPPLFPELKRRAEPKIFAVDELQVASGAGLLAKQIDPNRAGVAAAPLTSERSTTTATAPKRIDPTASIPGAHAQSAEAEGKPYVVITGLVPIDKQTLEYNDKFALAMPAELDPSKPPPPTAPQAGMPELPVYAVALVQRREVTPGMKADAPWPAADTAIGEMYKRYQEAVVDMGTWSNAWANQDIVDLNYVFQCDELPIPGFDPTAPQNAQSRGTLTRLVTMPLPPLLLRDWGLEAAHPKIRLNIPDDAAAATPGVNQGTTTPDLGLGGPVENPGAMKAPPPVSTLAPAPAAAPPRPAQQPAFTPQRPAYGPRSRSDHDERPSFGSVRPQMPSNTYAAPSATLTNQSVPNKLFRFVDFTVEPGKTYQYRVQLLVMNPNYGLKPECLEQAKWSGDKWVKSPMTEPTSPVTVPHLYQILADSVSSSRNAEPKVKINFWALFKAPPSETAMVPTAAGQQVWVEGMKEIADWALGSILAVRDTEFQDVFDPTAMELRTLKTVTVDTDQPMLLDVRNDDPLGGSKTKGPTELLMIDSAGRLSVASSAVDRFAKDEYTQMSKNATVSATQQSGPTGVAPLEHQQPKPGPTAPRKGGRND
jgi:hypothetical protein